MRLHFTLVVLSLIPLVSHAQERTFRTDADADDALPWYQVQRGEFPPAGSAHEFAGELIRADGVNRTGTLRVDRTDNQRRSDWDLPLVFDLLPYGSVRYHNAPAALRDVPHGTHLHGAFYKRAADEPRRKSIYDHRKSIEDDFNRVLRLEDDFSYHARRGEAWRVESVDLTSSKLTLLLVSTTDGGDPLPIENAKPQTFDLTEATRVWLGRGFSDPSEITSGQVMQINTTWATLYGPGRVTDIWLDDEAREVARLRQLATHRVHQKDRGLAGYVTAVDNTQRIVSVELFDGVAPQLIADFKPKSSATIVVAEPSLRSYDQVNDRKSGPVLSVDTAPDPPPGSSGVTVRVQPSLLLEGFRPGKVVRVFPSGWPVQSIPLEERLWPERE